jgi:hypothetical protein
MPLDITIQLRQFVIERAAYRCEYCLMPQTMAFHEHEPDHIIPRQHGGETEGGNQTRFRAPNTPWSKAPGIAFPARLMGIRRITPWFEYAR